MTDETPYAVLKRMKAEGHPRQVIIERLKSMGLDDSDIGVLTAEDLPELPEPLDADAKLLLRVGATVVAGPIGGLVVSALTADPPAPSAPLDPQQPLDPLDSSPRCLWHPTLASVSTCPRCGSFTCRGCAPRPDEKICEHCRTSPAHRDERIRTATRWVAVWMFVVAALAIGQAFLELTNGPGPDTQTRLAFVGLPFGVLGVIQATQRRLWPALVACTVVFPAMLALGAGGTWIIFAIVLAIASLFARSEIRAAHRDCVTSR